MGQSSEMEIDAQVFRSLVPNRQNSEIESPVRLVVWDYDRTLTLETRNSIVNDYVSGWKGQIDPWRALYTGPGQGWDSYDDQFTAAGLTAQELKEEFNRGKHTSEAYMQQVMQDFLRASFNDGENKVVAVRSAEFLQEEVLNPRKRLYSLKRMLAMIRKGLDQQSPRGKMVVTTYNSFGAIFVLNTLIHANLSQYFDAIHSRLNAVENVDGVWEIVRKERTSTRDSSLSDSSEISRHSSQLSVESRDIGDIRVNSAGKLDEGVYGKPDAVERLYNHCGGLSSAVLIDDEPEMISAWLERGGKHAIDLSKVPGDYKFTVPYIEQAERCFESMLFPS
jgi:hypothetical protein